MSQGEMSANTQSTTPPPRRGRPRNAAHPTSEATAPEAHGSGTQPSTSAAVGSATQAAIGFLLNESSNSANYPAMPKLESTSNTHFNAWKAKALLYFDQYGLR